MLVPGQAAIVIRLPSLLKFSMSQGLSLKVGIVTSPCAQVEHLADLLRNGVNSQWNPSIYEGWKPKL